MAKVKNPCFSFAAQGTVGPIHYSHHKGETYAYADNPRSQIPPTEAQKIARDDFTDGAERWSNFTQAERWFWTQVAARIWQPREKDCQKGRLTGYQTYIKFWRWVEPAPDKLLIFALIVIYIAFKFAIPLP